MGLSFEGQKDILYSQGMVEQWLSGKDVPSLVRDAFKVVSDELGRLRKEVEKQVEGAARQAELLEKQQALTGMMQHALKAKDDDGWRDRVQLVFDEKGACFVFVHPEEGESFGVGAAYQSSSLSGFEPTLETTPFSVAITLPYLKAIAKLLEVEASRIPVTRSASL